MPLFFKKKKTKYMCINETKKGEHGKLHRLPRRGGGPRPRKNFPRILRIILCDCAASFLI